MVKVNCANCGKVCDRFPSEIKRTINSFCNKSCNMSFQFKGKTPWNKGLTKETDERVKKYCDKRMEICEKRGYINSVGTIRKISKAKKGCVSPRKGKTLSLPTRIKISLSKTQEKEFTGFKQIIDRRIRMTRKYLEWRSAIFKRDNYHCQNCPNEEYIEAHHIISFAKLLKIYKIKTLEQAEKCKALWDIGNGITYCKECHIILDKNIGIGLQQTRSYS